VYWLNLCALCGNSASLRETRRVFARNAVDEWRIMGKRVVLAMSGGVDSSVAAALLKAQGYDVLGLFMRTGAHAVDEERRAKSCCSVADALDARNVADRLDIPFYVLDFEREFARIED